MSPMDFRALRTEYRACEAEARSLEKLRERLDFERKLVNARVHRMREFVSRLDVRALDGAPLRKSMDEFNADVASFSRRRRDAGDRAAAVKARMDAIVRDIMRNLPISHSRAHRHGGRGSSSSGSSRRTAIRPPVDMGPDPDVQRVR